MQAVAEDVATTLVSDVQQKAIDVAKTLVSDVRQEAVAEITGRSNRKWGVALVAVLLLATIVGIVVATRRGQPSPASDDQTPASPTSSPPQAAPAAT